MYFYRLQLLKRMHMYIYIIAIFSNIFFMSIAYIGNCNVMSKWLALFDIKGREMFAFILII